MRSPGSRQKFAVGIWFVVVLAALGLAVFAAETSGTKMIPVAVDSGEYADFMTNEVVDAADLADLAEIQRRFFNRITPPDYSWIQPMFPPVAPFDAANFTDSFLDGLLGEDKNSVTVYPLSLALDPMTRGTLVYNADGKLIANLPADRVSRVWPEDADPARVTLQLDLLPAEDVEPYLYVEDRIAKSSVFQSAKSLKARSFARRSLGVGQFGISDIQAQTNGDMQVTVSNGTDAAELYAYTVLYTSSVVVNTWTNEEDVEITDTNVLWTPVSPSFDGIQSEWACATTNLIFTNGVGGWADAGVSSNARARFYAAAKRTDTDSDGLTDGAEIFLHRTDPEVADTDGDGLSDGVEVIEYGSNPKDVDTDSDGLDDGDEVNVYGTDPNDPDFDGDGMMDGWEVDNGFDPSLDDGAADADPDGDGLTNAEEQQAGTDPYWDDTDGDDILDDIDPSPSTGNCLWGCELNYRLPAFYANFSPGAGFPVHGGNRTGVPYGLCGKGIRDHEYHAEWRGGRLLHDRQLAICLDHQCQNIWRGYHRRGDR